MSITINGQNRTRLYENASLNLFLLSENLEKNKNYLTHLATDSKKQFIELKADWDSKFIGEDTYLFYLKQIASFVEKLNEPISYNLLADIMDEFEILKGNPIITAVNAITDALESSLDTATIQMENGKIVLKK